MPARRNPPLQRAEIVAAALALTATDGLATLSMRALAEQLGVTPMALYRHVKDKDTLIGLVADAVLEAVPMPESSRSWDAWLVAYHDGLWAQLRRYPGVGRQLLEHPTTPAGGAMRRRTVEVLETQGFDRRDALLAASTFHTHLLGRLAIETSFAGISPGSEPGWRTEALAADDYVAYGLATIVSGLRAQRKAGRRPGPPIAKAGVAGSRGP